MKPGTYVTDKSDSSRYYRPVYQVTGESFDRCICRKVGDLVNGRLQSVNWRDQHVTHRTTANLQEYR